MGLSGYTFSMTFRWRCLVALLFILPLLQPALACGRSAPATTRPAGAVTETGVEDAVLELVNRERRRAGVGELAPDSQLSRIAREHSEEMRDNGFFDHVTPDGEGLVERMREGGVAFRRVAENVARVDGYREPAAALHRTLMGSAAHRSNMLDDRFTQVGIGVAREGDRWWLTQVFLRPPG